MASNVQGQSSQIDEKKLPERIATAAKEIPGQIKTVVQDMPAKVAEAGHAIEETLDEQIRTRPLAVGGVAVGVGAGLGLLFARTKLAKLVLLAGAGLGLYAYFNREQVDELLGKAREKIGTKGM